VSKVLVDGSTACYVSALNRSMATDASSIPDVAPDAVSSFISRKGLIDSTNQHFVFISLYGWETVDPRTQLCAEL
jgi:hypothetical protein